MRAKQLQHVIPLAGPDFVMPDGSLKPLHEIEGEPLLLRALKSRAWYGDLANGCADLVFVLRDTPQTPGFRDFLRQHFPSARHVVLPDVTRGALLSAAAGVAMLRNLDSPVCVDLVDIVYSLDLNPVSCFEDDACRGILPYFESEDPKFSYLELDGGRVVRTAEKQVISKFASAGTYFFGDVGAFFDSTSASLRHVADWSVNGVLFVCPAFNALVSGDDYVAAVPVGNVQPVSCLFHA